MAEKRQRRTYTDEFKNQLVQLYLNGKRKCDIIREYDIAASLRNIFEYMGKGKC